MNEIVDTNIESIKKDLILQPLNSMEELQDWLYLYFDIYFPSGVVSPDSSHGPADAMWRVYELMKTGGSAKVPEVVMMASRDSGKTLCAAALEVLCMIHFRISVCHMAAITTQSSKAIQYVELFFRKITPYLEQHGWSKNSNNKKIIEWISEDGQNIYLKIIVATIAGANSEHVPMLFCLDGKTEIAVINPQPKRHDGDRNRFRKTKTARGIYRDIKKGKKVDILSFNHSTNCLEFKPCNKTTKSIKDIYRLTLYGGKYLDATLDHRVFVLSKGYIPMSEVVVGDSLINFNKAQTKVSTLTRKPESTVVMKISEKEDTFREVLIGSLLGDGHVGRRYNDKNKNNGYFVENHCAAQKDYIGWKASIFEEKGFKVVFNQNAKSGYTGELQYKLHSGNNVFFNDWVGFKDNFHLTGILEDMGPLALAVWYQDDGYSHGGLKLATHGFKEDQVTYLSDLINRKFGFNTCLKWENKQDGRGFPYISGSAKDMYKMYIICGHLFQPCMRFKFYHIENQTIKKCRYCQSEFTVMEMGTTGVCCKDNMCQLILKEKIKPLKVISKEFVKTDDVFDFTVEDNHNLIANGLLIHNCDEVDVIQDPRALEESKMIPSSYKQYQPMMIYLSTLKFSGGLMSKVLKSVKSSGGEILKWNIIDITERISPEEARVNEPRVTRYISKTLPMENLSARDWDQLREEDQSKYDRIEAYAGIAEHPMLPVMKNYLVDRPEKDRGGLFKKVFATHNLFKKLSIEMADAQLLCNKPSSSNLVYPRFDPIHNVISLDEAWERVSGNKVIGVDQNRLRDYLLSMGVTFIGGADWGYTDYTSMVVLAVMPGGFIWIVDSFLADKLELDDICKYAMELNTKWGIDKWWVDQNYPAYKATLRKKGLKVPDFTKVVADGIAAIQSRIVDNTSVRRFFVLDIPQNKKIIDMFGTYKWALDGKGDIIEGKPYHDRDGDSDIADSLRYPMQNLFARNGKIMFSLDHSPAKAKTAPNQPQDLQAIARAANSELMNSKMKELVPNYENTKKAAVVPKKKIFWS